MLKRKQTDLSSENISGIISLKAMISMEVNRAAHTEMKIGIINMINY